MGGISLVTGPALDIVSLAEARKHCRVDIADDDGLISGYILAARRHCEIHTGRSLIEQTFDLTVDNDWPFVGCLQRIVIPIVPLVSVTSINYIDVDGNSQLLAANQYRVITRSAAARGWIEPAYGVTWPTVRCISEAITVRFVAGYGTQPGAHPNLDVFRQAMLLLIGHWYENREAVVMGATSDEMPLGVASLLHPMVIDGLP
jgi:uncharacterized phiE125 gp8 family phage protein